MTVAIDLPEDALDPLHAEARRTSSWRALPMLEALNQADETGGHGVDTTRCAGAPRVLNLAQTDA